MKNLIKKQMYFQLILLLTIWLNACSLQSAQNLNISNTVLSEDGSPITYGVMGHGEPAIVFIHCWTCNHNFWDKQIAYFSRTHQVIWLDLAGHGQSGSHRISYTMAAFGEDVAAVVNKVKARKVVLVGHSMGGPVAIEAAKLLGNKVVAVVGVDTFYTPFKYPEDQASIKQFVKPFETDFRATSDKLLRSMFVKNITPSVRDEIVGRFSEANSEVGISALYELFNWNATQAKTDLNQYADILYNINAAPTGREMPPNDHTIMIPHVGHFIAQVKPQEFNTALEDIILKVKQRSREIE